MTKPHGDDRLATFGISIADSPTTTHWRDMNQTLTATSDREAWLAARRRCITATDIAAILNLHPYRSAHQVYLDKMGVLPETPENEAMRWGNLLEPVIGRRFAEGHNLEVVPGGFTLHHDVDYFGCTPDFLVGDDELLEVKTAGTGAGKNFGQSGTDEVPDQYLCQVMWQLAVTGRKVGHLAVLIAGQDYREFRIRRDDEMIRRMEFAGRRFWGEYVAKEIAPPLSGSKADSEFINSKHSRDDGSLIQATDDIEELVAEIGHLLVDARGLAVKEAELVNQIKAFMGDATTLRTDEGSFTWKATKDRETTDWKRVAEILADRFGDSATLAQLVVENTIITSGSRRFTTPFKRIS